MNNITFRLRAHGNNKSIVRISVLLFLIISIYSCRKTDTGPNKFNLPISFHFTHSDFIGDIECYDTEGNLIEYDSGYFIQNDFLFDDYWLMPYDNIEVYKDSSVHYYYIRQEFEYVHYGNIKFMNDSIYFYIDEWNIEFVISGSFNGNQLLFPVYGAKYARFHDSISGYSTMTRFGEPDIQYLIERINDYNEEGLYLQKFNLMYDPDFSGNYCQ